MALGLLQPGGRNYGMLEIGLFLYRLIVCGCYFPSHRYLLGRVALSGGRSKESYKKEFKISDLHQLTRFYYIKR